MQIKSIYLNGTCWLQLEASKVASSNLSGDIVEKFFGLKTVHFEGILTF
jgi:hypothetical protein